MGKQTKSQWDFGELFPAETTRRILSFGQLTSHVKDYPTILEAKCWLVSKWIAGSSA